MDTMAAMLAQHFRHIILPRLFRHVKRRVAVGGLGVDLGFVGDEQFRHVLAAKLSRQMQRRQAAIVFGVHVGLARMKIRRLRVPLLRRQVQSRLIVGLVLGIDLRFVSQQSHDFQVPI